jgi:two-component system CheB/CheR fusion protein
VHSDPALVSQLLRNLISNALKYTRDGSVEVRCFEVNGRMRVEVRDTGVGIAPDQLPLIFEEFYQVGVSPNTSRDGYGLGLSIVRRIVKLLDLVIDVKSEPGRGSSFAVELPLAVGVESVQHASPDAGATNETHAGGERILLVEDEAGVRNAMRTLLRMEGYHVIAAATAEEAELELAGDETFDLMITDYHLEPGRTGTQVIARARERFGEGFNAILVTGDTSSAVREMPCDAGLRITSKPINSRELLRLIRTLLAHPAADNPALPARVSPT